MTSHEQPAVTIGALIVPQLGEMSRMREAWMEAEEIGVDRLYTADHFFVPRPEDYDAQDRHIANDPTAREAPPTPELPADWQEPKNFEATTIQAAMCATTRKAEVSCLVHCNAFRNPNLLADMARTMDHISGGRFVLGIGSGFHRRDFEEYGYELGTYGSRLRDLDRDLGVIRARWQKLSPPPLRRIPILIAGGGEKLALQVVARHADEWHAFGNLATLRQKSKKLDEWCVQLGRDPREIRRVAALRFLDETPLESLVDAGFTHIVSFSMGPDWDLTQIRELVAWRNAR